MRHKRKEAPFTLEYLKSVLVYYPITGQWHWLVKRPHVEIGDRAGSYKSKRRCCIKVGGIGYKAANLAWFYMTGQWPELEIDHKNRNETDDRWENLRQTTRSQNCTNRVMPAKL